MLSCVFSILLFVVLLEFIWIGFILDIGNVFVIVEVVFCGYFSMILWCFYDKECDEVI